MSPVSSPSPPKSTVPEDPFRYGWRYVRVEDPSGNVTFDQVPLTLEDVLHPEVGDFIVQTDGHDSDLNYLKDVFKAQLADDPTKAAISDCRVDWNLPGVRPLGPDVAVFDGIKQHRDWATFNVQEEGARPLLVVEVTSPDTRKNDVETKVDYYHRAKVPLHVIADVLEQGEERVIALIGYRYTPNAYERVQPDEQGRIWLEPVQLRLGLTLDRLGNYQRLACFDPTTGAEVGDYTAISIALAAAAEAREEAASRMLEAETRVLEAETRVLQESKARAEAEARVLAGEEAEARIRELEERLRQG